LGEVAAHTLRHVGQAIRSPREQFRLLRRYSLYCRVLEAVSSEDEPQHVAPVLDGDGGSGIERGLLNEDHFAVVAATPASDSSVPSDAPGSQHGDAASQDHQRLGRGRMEVTLPQQCLQCAAVDASVDKSGAEGIATKVGAASAQAADQSSTLMALGPLATLDCCDVKVAFTSILARPP